VNPLDGSPALTSPVQFAPNPALGLPAITSSKGNGNYAATWLNSAISGLTGNATLGTLTVQVPANAPSSAAYAVHFDHASASPNGLASFPKQTQNGLITLSDRSASSWNDGIPDAWRLRHFGSIYNVLSAPDADADSDGVVNLDEFRAGTDPNNAQSKLKLLTSPSLNNGLFKISWPTVLNKRYVLEGSSTLYGDSWTVIATNIVGDGNLKEFLDTNNPMPFRFYRVKAE